MFWANIVTAIRIGTGNFTLTGYTSSWSLDGTNGNSSKPSRIIFDTGTSFTYFPQQYANDIFNRLLKNKVYNKFFDGSITIDCS
jgi:hypothetical protein